MDQKAGKGQGSHYHHGEELSVGVRGAWKPEVKTITAIKNNKGKVKLERWRFGQVALWTLSMHAARWKSQLLIGPDGVEKAANYGRFPTHTAKRDVHIRPRVSTHTIVHMNSQSLDLYNTTVGQEIFEAFQHPGERQDSGFSQRGRDVDFSTTDRSYTKTQN
ncbi:hypothetical protein IRJ41_001448 [Triplophysa rosa]|uniref:Uncharacterized protein n=1 Tax=Triplophysa rosa TaxID=992332 RepID=A0A9W7T6W7_TRIRA|nr:hypothetical protein IRJ41_001448 [Triplophysa rosa]